MTTTPQYIVSTPQGSGHVKSKTALINGKLIIYLDSGKTIYCHIDNLKFIKS